MNTASTATGMVAPNLVTVTTILIASMTVTATPVPCSRRLEVCRDHHRRAAQADMDQKGRLPL